MDRYFPYLNELEPEMNDERRFLYIAILLNSALYLTGVFVAGLMTGNRLAWAMALATAALCYLSPLVQAIGLDKVWRTGPLVLVALSILFGGAAGIVLVIA